MMPRSASEYEVLAASPGGGGAPASGIGAGGGLRSFAKSRSIGLQSGVSAECAPTVARARPLLMLLPMLRG
jgi:hypothetical protein